MKLNWYVNPDRSIIMTVSENWSLFGCVCGWIGSSEHCVPVKWTETRLCPNCGADCGDTEHPVLTDWEELDGPPLQEKSNV